MSGPGYIGLEMVEALCARGVEITLVEQLHRFCPLWTSNSAPWSLGTQVLKVFNLVIARTGLRDHEAAGFIPARSPATPAPADGNS